MNGVAQCLFHHIPIRDHVFTTQSNTMKFRGGRKDPAMTHSLVLWLNETGDPRSYNLVEHLQKHTSIHPCVNTKMILFKLSTHFSMLVK